MQRRLVWAGIITCLLGIWTWSGCQPAGLGVAGGYMGWRNEGTGGSDAKLTSEVSLQSSTPLMNGIWINYVNYDNTNNGQRVKSISTYVDHSAPVGTFTVDGARQQHFTDHVGQLVATATDANHDGIICWVGCSFERGAPGAGDYTLSQSLCPSVGGTASSTGNGGFTAYCNQGVWIELAGAVAAEETKKGVGTGLLYGTSNYLVVFNPITLGQIVASSTPLPNNVGFVVTINAVSLSGGASHTLASPLSANIYGAGSGIAINADQPGLKELASWLSSQWINQPDGETKITATFNNGAASQTVTIASGHSIAVALQSYASW